MKLVKVLLIALLIVSCNDQISEDLSATTSSGTSTSTTTTEVDGLTLTSANDSYMSYFIHEIGSSTEGCSLEGPFTVAAPKTIDCFLEVEELDLYLSGADVTLTGTAERCEYIGFFPYHFYQYQPGATQKDVLKATCPSNCEGTCDTYFTGIVGTPFATGGDGTYYSLDGGANWTQFAPGDVTSSQDRCDYDYSDLETPGPNCDDGEYSIATYAFTYDANAGTCAGPATVPTPTISTCGGKKKACIQGPIRDFLSTQEIEDSGSTYQLTDTQDETFTNTYQFQSPFSRGLRTNMYVANYTKQCGADNTTPFYYPGNAGAASAADDNTIEAYATNANLYDGIFQANDAFAVEGGTNPHYTFYCLSRSLEVMARIRLIVRDWDDEFTDLSETQFNLEILDNGNVVAGNAGGFMDNIGFETTTSPINNLEDRYDWDNDTVNRMNLDFDGGGPNAACSYPTTTTTNSNGYFPQGNL